MAFAFALLPPFRYLFFSFGSCVGEGDGGGGLMRKTEHIVPISQM